MFEKDQIEYFFCKLIEKRKIAEKQLFQYPEGELKVDRKKVRGKTYEFFYIQYPKKPRDRRIPREYITSDKEKVRIMARKLFLQKSLERLNENIDVLKEAIDNLEDISTDAVLESLDPNIAKQILFQKQKDYLLPQDPEEAQKHMEWIRTPYLKNPKHSENLKHRTSTGESTRSKSEVLIYEKLKEFKMAFRYDSQLLIGGEEIFPDFTIRRTDGQIFYWEHFGRCDLQRYREEYLWKLRLFESVGIGPWNNLIITFDVGDGMIDMREIEALITNKLRE